MILLGSLWWFDHLIIIPLLQLASHGLKQFLSTAEFSNRFCHLFQHILSKQIISSCQKSLILWHSSRQGGATEIILLYDIAVILWVTLYHKNCMTCYITLGYQYIASWHHPWQCHFRIECSASKVTKLFKQSYDKQNSTFVFSSYEMSQR